MYVPPSTSSIYIIIMASIWDITMTEPPPPLKFIILPPLTPPRIFHCCIRFCYHIYTPLLPHLPPLTVPHSSRYCPLIFIRPPLISIQVLLLLPIIP